VACREVRIGAVTSKWQSLSIIGEGFERAFDEAFEEFLIRRWRSPERVRRLGKTLVIEDDQNYRIKMALPDADPEELEVEVSEWHLMVRMPASQGDAEETCDFSHCIDTERVTASFEAGMLEVLAPKSPGRKIEVR
jgi:HSP20 family molecular chaperone IbpA